jgi:hypothetical protein
MGRFFKETGKVGLILASNLGRPFGASGSKVHQNSAASGYVGHPDASTQEEAAITTVQHIHKNLDSIHSIPGSTFRRQFEAYTLNDTDNFWVPLLQKNAHHGLMAKDYANTVLNLSVHDEKLEVVLVSAPNAGPDHSPAKPNACIVAQHTKTYPCTHIPRGTRHNQLDSVYRTIDHKACTDYNYMIEGLVSGMTAALERCIQKDVKVVIIPAMGTGLYAGQWKDRLQQEYYDKVVTPSLQNSNSKTRFTKIFAPDPSSSKVDEAPGFFGAFQKFLKA